MCRKAFPCLGLRLFFFAFCVYKIKVSRLQNFGIWVRLIRSKEDRPPRYPLLMVKIYKIIFTPVIVFPRSCFS